MGGLENDEVSNSLVMKEEKYEAPFMRARLRRGLEAGSQIEPGSADPVREKQAENLARKI